MPTNEKAALDKVNEIAPQFSEAVVEAYPDGQVEEVFIVGLVRREDGGLGMIYAATTTDWTDQLAAARVWGRMIEGRLG